jgi:hypothetical protein
MPKVRRLPGPLYRIWVVRCERWRPAAWTDLPLRSIAVELAEPQAMPADQTLPFLEGFNRTMLDRRARLWAVAVPVTLRYEGDLRPGQIVMLTELKLLDCRNCVAALAK